VLGVQGAGVSLAGEDGTLRFATATDERVMRVEECQLELDEGPCHEAWRSGQIVCEVDLNRSRRWPTYTPVALETGWQAVAGVPMIVEDQHIGALNLYRSQPDEWSPDELQSAQLLTDMAAGYIINARALTESAQLAEQLQRALDSRVVIEQAKGVLAGRHGIDT
jgi:GAF domain-containing protein